MARPEGETRLSVDDAEALVAIRSVMEEGIQRTNDSTPTGRMTAAVLMLSACEAAVYLGCDALSVDIEDRKRFDDHYSGLMAALKANGSFSANERLLSWRHVTRLRHLRNGAVHQLIAPDAERLRGLTAHVEEFISTLVERCFGVALQEVVASASIEDVGVRERLVEAERALAGGRWTDAVLACMSAFEASKSGWRTVASHAKWLHVDTGTSLLARGELRELLGPALTAVEEVADALRALPFAVDPAEFVWFRSLGQGVSRSGSSRHWEYSEGDARRAIRFVTGWQYRFESFRTTYNAEIATRPPPVRATSRADRFPELCWDETRASRVRSVDVRGEETQLVEVAIPIAFDPASAEHLHQYGSILTKHLADMQLQAWFSPYDGLVLQHGEFAAQQGSVLEDGVRLAWERLQRDLGEERAAAEKAEAWRSEIDRRLAALTASDGEHIFESLGADPSQVVLTRPFRGFDRDELELFVQTDAEQKIVGRVGPYALELGSDELRASSDADSVENDARLAAALLERARDARAAEELEADRQLQAIADQWKDSASSRTADPLGDIERPAGSW